MKSAFPPPGTPTRSVDISEIASGNIRAPESPPRPLADSPEIERVDVNPFMAGARQDDSFAVAARISLLTFTEIAIRSRI